MNVVFFLTLPHFELTVSLQRVFIYFYFKVHDICKKTKFTRTCRLLFQTGNAKQAVESLALNKKRMTHEQLLWCWKALKR